MNDQETSETTATQSSEETEMYTWEVWRRDAIDLASSHRATMERVGALHSESARRPWGYYGAEAGALKAIAEMAGSSGGEFMLIHDDRVHRLSIVAETVYRLKEES